VRCLLLPPTCPLPPLVFFFKPRKRISYPEIFETSTNWGACKKGGGQEEGFPFPAGIPPYSHGLGLRGRKGKDSFAVGGETKMDPFDVFPIPAVGKKHSFAREGQSIFF